jgi:lipid A 3-O-deacylase
MVQANIAAIFLALAAVVHAADEPLPRLTGRFAIVEENDSLYNPWGPHTDRHYTQGFRVIYVNDSEALAGFTGWYNKNFPPLGWNAPCAQVGFFFGQSIYTPENIKSAQLQKDDRPYAGWLHLGATVQRQGTSFGSTPTLEALEIQLGVVGPEALGAEAQTGFHKFYEFATPEGWDNQLKTEIGFLLKYARAWRIDLTPGDNPRRYLDLIPQLGGAAGNIHVSAALTTTLRGGWNLPDDFGYQPIDSMATVHSAQLHNHSSRFSAYGFGRLEGRAVAHNIFLDGNTWRDSHSVDRIPWVADMSWGFSFAWRLHPTNLTTMELTYLNTHRTREFEGQKGSDRLGSLSLLVQVQF